MRLITQDEGLALFQALNHQAEEHLHNSKDAFTSAFICLNRIREQALYTYGGYDDWGSYYDDFLAHNGVSRSLGYANLATTRIAKRCGFSEDEIQNYGLVALNPWFEKGPIVRYDRATGEVLAVDESIFGLLESGELSQSYGEYVKEHVKAGEPAALVRREIAAMLQKGSITFEAYYHKGIPAGLRWYTNCDSGLLLFASTIPDDIWNEMCKRLKVVKTSL